MFHVKHGCWRTLMCGLIVFPGMFHVKHARSGGVGELGLIEENLLGKLLNKRRTVADEAKSNANAVGIMIIRN